MDSNLISRPEDLLQGQAMRHIATPEDLPNTEPGTYQALVLDGLSIIGALLFGLSYRMYLAGAISPWWLIGVMLASGAMTGLHALLAANKVRRLLIIFGEVIAASVFFYDFDPVFLSIAAFLLFAFLSWSYLETRRELSFGTEIRFFKHTHGALGKFITGSLLFMVLLYVPQLTPGATFIPEKVFTGFFDWSGGIVEKWYPNVPLTGSFGDLAEQLASSQLVQNPAFENLSPQNQSVTVSQNANALIGNFSKTLGMTIHASDTVPTTLYQYLQKTLNGWRNRFATVFLLGWTALIFFILRSVGIIFILIDQLILGAIYEILLALKLITIKEQPATREVITYR